MLQVIALIEEGSATPLPLAGSLTGAEIGVWALSDHPVM